MSQITGSVFVMIGGYGLNDIILSDVWLFDTSRSAWKKVLQYTYFYSDDSMHAHKI